MTSIDTTHDDALREVPFAKEDIYNGRILHVEKWKVTCPNGREAAREIVVHKGAAAVVPVFENAARASAPRSRRSRDAGNPGGQAGQRRRRPA